MDSPFSLALMHSVSQAAKDLGMPLRREQLLWVLHRSKGDECLAISLASAQGSAQRALKALYDPSVLSSFDVSGVTPAMVAKVKETLKSDVLKRVTEELDLIDEEAGESFLS
jgi:hypothetical protein